MPFRTAGVAGSVTVTTRNSAGQLVTPVSIPVVKWYTDTARITGEVTLTTTGSGSTYTAAWTAGQAPATPATRYLKITIEVSAGVYDYDVDDTISFVDAGASIDDTNYTTAALVRQQLGITDTDDDTLILAAVAAASRAIDRTTGTTFYPITEARYYVPTSAGDVWVDRFVTTTGMTVQTGTDGTYTTTVSSSDVVAWPYNAVTNGGAYCRLLVPTYALPASSGGRATVKVTAQWGYSSVPDNVEEACRIKAARLFRRKDSPEGVAGTSEFGVVRISKYEDPDVAMLLAPYTDAGIA